MRRLLAATFILLCVSTVRAAEPEDLAAPTRAPPWGPDPSPDSATARLVSAAGLAAWVAVAGVVGLVVVSSLAKTRPVPGDPLVTAPGVPIVHPRRSASPFVPVPHLAAYDAGRDLAHRASPASVQHVLALASALGLGEAVLTDDGRGGRVVRIAECSSCRARGRDRHWLRRARTEAACGFEEGFLAGAFECALGRSVNVSEKRCGAGHDRTCEFLVT